MRVSRVGGVAIGFVCAATVLVLVFRSHAPSVAPASVEQPMYAVENGNVVVQDTSPLLRRLTIAPAIERTLPHAIEVPGQVIAIPSRQVNVLAPVAGRIIDVAVRLGQHVTRGQVLATVAAGDLDQALADNGRAQAALTFARRAYLRAQGVQAVGGNAVKDLDSARNDFIQAQAEAERAHRRLQALGAQTGYSLQGQIPLISPVDGFVSTLSMAPGQNITDTGAVQMTLVNTSDIWVAAAVPENRLSQVHDGIAVRSTFPALPGKVCEGPLITADPTLHTDTRRLNAYASCPNPDGTLRPGMFATVMLKIPQGSEIMLPKSALLMDNDRVSVFVETAAHTFRRRYVNISYDEGDEVRIISGLTPHERIVTSGAILLNDD